VLCSLLETFGLGEIDVGTSMTEYAGAHFLVDDGILLGGRGRLGMKVCLAVLLFFCCILGMGDELIVGEKELVELLDVLREGVPSRLLGMRERAPKGGSKIGDALLMTATGTGHVCTLSAPRRSGGGKRVDRVRKTNGREGPEEDECIWRAVDVTDRLLAGVRVVL
jgi:hypothetical protein